MTFGYTTVTIADGIKSSAICGFPLERSTQESKGTGVPFSKYFVLSLKRRTYRACPMCKASLLYLDEQMREFNNRKNENLSEMAIDNGR